jgi:phasin family protein
MEDKMANETKPKADKKYPWEMALPDFTKLLEGYKIPGVDFSALVDREKKNIEALTKANRIAFEGWQALVRRQSEILQETMKEAVANARQQDAAKHRVELAKQGFEKALNHMRELAEIATKSQKDAFEVVRKQADENFEQFKKLGKGK